MRVELASLVRKTSAISRLFPGYRDFSRFRRPKIPGYRLAIGGVDLPKYLITTVF